MAPREALGREAKPRVQVEHRPLFPDLDAQSLIALKPTGFHLPFERSEISPHQWGPSLWQPSSFLDRWARAKKAWSIEGEEEV